MQRNNNPVIEMLETWNHDYRTKFIVLRDAGAVTLLVKDYFGESNSLSMSDSEAAQLAADISKLLPAGNYIPRTERNLTDRNLLRTERVDEASGLTILVTDTNKGEPYEDGIRIEFIGDNYNAAISLDMDFYTARTFAKALATPA